MYIHKYIHTLDDNKKFKKLNRDQMSKKYENKLEIKENGSK